MICFLDIYRLIVENDFGNIPVLTVPNPGIQPRVPEKYSSILFMSIFTTIEIVFYFKLDFLVFVLYLRQYLGRKTKLRWIEQDW